MMFNDDVLVVRVDPETVEDIPYFCEQLIHEHPNLYTDSSYWDHQSLVPNYQYAKGHNTNKYGKYLGFVDDNLDILDQARQGVFSRNKVTNCVYKPRSGDRFIWGEILCEWQYPIDCVDNGWDWDNFNKKDQWFMWDEGRNMRGVQQKALRKRGYGFKHGLNKGEKSGDLASILCHDNTERYAWKPWHKYLKPISLIEQT